ncbi:ribose-phosphate pyrophosphokinase family protein [Tritrichomonas foetus]|uniref:ribose-phosphate diphosphokinase n=1 Tax=Tritrichomonas foetus TaxID=1144522 RepID=A0A1J4JR45_9EUKA|nr:ribose-phosphate pyrophosphokinase family protein [Tritrichomonas foetus]|eukprot:OHT01499.1 ribose-phosphate pyrophosphokinase family protein [Tritrichomonas foetus]
MAEVVVLEHPNSSYIARSITEELADLGVKISHVDIERSSFPNGEKYYRLKIPSDFALLGKTSVYIASVTNDEEILDLYRIGTALAQEGIKRRIFVIPFLAYLSMDRAAHTGEIVTAKCNSQMFGMVGAATEGNVFVFLDLHYACVLHYFEGPCLRVELKAQNSLLRAIADQNYDKETMMMGSTNLRRAAWVNTYAQAMNIPISFVREKPKPDQTEFISQADGVVGNVEGRRIIIYDDIVRSGKTLINAAECYLQAGATSVVGVTSHFTCFSEQQIHDLINSKLEKIIITNSHPISQHPLVQECDKFVIVDVSEIFTQCLYEILPTPEHMHRSSI